MYKLYFIVLCISSWVSYYLIEGKPIHKDVEELSRPVNIGQVQFKKRHEDLHEDQQHGLSFAHLEESINKLLDDDEDKKDQHELFSFPNFNTSQFGEMAVSGKPDETRPLIAFQPFSSSFSQPSRTETRFSSSPSSPCESLRSPFPTKSPIFGMKENTQIKFSKRQINNLKRLRLFTKMALSLIPLMEETVNMIRHYTAKSAVYRKFYKDTIKFEDPLFVFKQIKTELKIVSDSEVHLHEITQLSLQIGKGYQNISHLIEETYRDHRNKGVEDVHQNFVFSGNNCIPSYLFNSVQRSGSKSERIHIKHNTLTFWLQLRSMLMKQTMSIHYTIFRMKLYYDNLVSTYKTQNGKIQQNLSNQNDNRGDKNQKGQMFSQSFRKLEQKANPITDSEYHEFLYILKKIPIVKSAFSIMDDAMELRESFVDWLTLLEMAKNDILSADESILVHGVNDDLILCKLP